MNRAGTPAKVVREEDIGAIMEKGVMLTPALITRGELKVSGRVAGVDEIVSMLMG